jgi:hypothetical protein
MAGESAAAVLVDESSNVVGIILDGGIYRLQTETKIVGVVPLPAGAATEATLASILASGATETTLVSVLAALGPLATEATLVSLNAKDFATETTLAALFAAFGAEDFATQTTLASLLAAFNAEDFATQATLAALLVAFNAEDFATQATLATLLTETAFQARINTLGQKAMVASTPVAIASDQSRLDTVLHDSSGNEVTVKPDGAEFALNVTGKVSTVAPAPPPAGTAFLLVSDTPLNVSTVEEGQRHATGPPWSAMVAIQSSFVGYAYPVVASKSMQLREDLLNDQLG